MTFRKLSQLIARQEGFGRPGEIPTTHHNPGDLRHSPHSHHQPGNPDGIGEIDTDEHGWQDLERQIELDTARGKTLRTFVAGFAPPNENNTSVYLENIFQWSRPFWPRTTRDSVLADFSDQKVVA